MEVCFIRPAHRFFWHVWTSALKFTYSIPRAHLLKWYYWLVYSRKNIRPFSNGRAYIWTGLSVCKILCVHKNTLSVCQISVTFFSAYQIRGSSV